MFDYCFTMLMKMCWKTMLVWTPRHPEYRCAWRLHTHRSERWYCSWTPMQASLLSVPRTIYPAGWLLPQTPDQCGTLWNDLSCRKATTPPQIAGQRTVSATRRCLWPKDKPTWGPFVYVCVRFKVVSDKGAVLSRGGERSMWSLTLGKSFSLFSCLCEGI